MGQVFPTSIDQWLTAVVAVFAIVGTIIAVIRWFARDYVDERVESEFRERLEVAVGRALDPVHLRLTTMTGEMSRLRQVEEDVTRLIAKVENGLQNRTERIEEKLDALILAHATRDDDDRRRRR